MRRIDEPVRRIVHLWSPRMWLALALLWAVLAGCMRPATTRGDLDAVALELEPLPGVRVAGQWQALDPMPMGVLAAAISRSGNSAVITGGITQLGAAAATVQIFDLDSLTWRKTLQLNHPRFMHAQVTLRDGRVLVIGGRIGSPRGHMQDTDACEIIDLTDGRVTRTDSLPVPMGDLTAHRMGDGRVIAVGGQTAAIFDDQAMAWTQTIPLRQRRRAHDSLLLPDGRVLVAGGVGRDSFELIDPHAGTSLLLAPRLPMTVNDHRMTLLPDGRAWILGGQRTSTGHTTDRTWLLDWRPRELDEVAARARGEQTATPRLLDGPSLLIEEGVADHVLVELDERYVVIAGGESERHGRDTELADAWLLDRHTLAVARLPAMSQAHDDAVAIAHDGSVIVFGGFVEKTVPLIGRVPFAVNHVERLRFTVP